MFELTLEDGHTQDVDESYFDFSEYENGLIGLHQLFNGEMMLNVCGDKVVPLDTELMSDNPGDYHRIESVKWDASNRSDWDGYIFNWLNDQESADGAILDLFHGGIQSGMTQLIYTKECHEVLGKYTADIENVLSEVLDSLGGESFCAMFKNGFDFTTLVQCAFEERLRYILECELQITW